MATPYLQVNDQARFMCLHFKKNYEIFFQNAILNSKFKILTSKVNSKIQTKETFQRYKKQNSFFLPSYPEKNKIGLTPTQVPRQSA